VSGTAATGFSSVSAVAPDAFVGYEVLAEVHRGGQGVVYKAIHKPTGRRVAIKVMRDGIAGDQKDAARFEREVQILGELEHPGIVGIHTSGVKDGRFYYVMDFVEGVLLDSYALGCTLRKALGALRPSLRRGECRPPARGDSPGSEAGEHHG
jgi:serine/threonine protein kinase